MQVSILCPTTDVQLDWRAGYARLSQSLEAAGLSARAIPWTELDAAQDCDAIACLAWGYHLEPRRWTNLLRGRTGSKQLVNSARSLLWNADKIYLRDLSRHVPTVPTHFADQLDAALLSKLRDKFRSESLVVKPRWGASGHGLMVLDAGSDIPALSGMLVQPRLGAVERDGEQSLIYFEGRFSHAVRKLPARGEIRVQSDFGGRVEPSYPSAELIALGERAISAAPDELAYARVDLVRGEHGSWQLMELEAIEPELFLEFGPDDGRAFGRAIANRLCKGRLAATSR
jgi:hypothetical protein